MDSTPHTAAEITALNRRGEMTPGQRLGIERGRVCGGELLESANRFLIVLLGLEQLGFDRLRRRDCGVGCGG